MNHLLPKRPTGDGGLQVWLERIKEGLRSSKILESPDVVPTVTSQGTFLRLRPRGAAGTPGATQNRYRVEQVNNDSLQCRKLEGSSVGDTLTLIAKPHHLRYSTWHGKTIIYQVESYPDAPASMTINYQFMSPVYRIARVTTPAGNTEEHQVIVERYIAGVSIIKAVEIENGTGVTGTTLEDTNDGGRAWARVV